MLRFQALLVILLSGSPLRDREENLANPPGLTLTKLLNIGFIEIDDLLFAHREPKVHLPPHDLADEDGRSHIFPEIFERFPPRTQISRKLFGLDGVFIQHHLDGRFEFLVAHENFDVFRTLENELSFD